MGWEEDGLEVASIPRLYAAASLKHVVLALDFRLHDQYSAALCRGLIEGASAGLRSDGLQVRIPRLYAAASLKPVAGDRGGG